MNVDLVSKIFDKFERMSSVDGFLSYEDLVNCAVEQEQERVMVGASVDEGVFNVLHTHTSNDSHASPSVDALPLRKVPSSLMV